MDKIDRKLLRYILGSMLIMQLTVYMYVRNVVEDMQEAHYTAMRQVSMLVLSISSPEELDELKRAIIKSEFVKGEKNE